MSTTEQYFEAIADYSGVEGDANYIPVKKSDIVRLIKKSIKWFTIEKDGHIGKVPKRILVQKGINNSQNQINSQVKPLLGSNMLISSISSQEQTALDSSNSSSISNTNLIGRQVAATGEIFGNQPAATGENNVFGQQAPETTAGNVFEMLNKTIKSDAKEEDQNDKIEEKEENIKQQDSKIAVPKEYNVVGGLTGLGLDILLEVLTETPLEKDAQRLVAVSKQTLKLKDHPRLLKISETFIKGLNPPSKKSQSRNQNSGYDLLWNGGPESYKPNELSQSRDQDRGYGRGLFDQFNTYDSFWGEDQDLDNPYEPFWGKETVEKVGRSDGISFVHTKRNDDKCTITVDPIVEKGISKLEFVLESVTLLKSSILIKDQKEKV
ncbi:MAG: hypothetical protein EZS28_028592 [Streblomastix strix]|uniref:SH3 domain-containing protein n=1 Tax=Streblomastix strix TaxID=222440 RepID=A0A5J4V0F8_9EUKA|nr:MAG: hypothetical protein EZS28_028592 [Streblomastix strix]